MSFSDETQEYLLVRPPQSKKPGKHTSRNIQIQRLLPTPTDNGSTTKLPRPRILPILNLESHAIGKTRIVETDGGGTICKFDREPRGILGKWQVDLRRGDGGGWIFVGKYERYEWAKSRNTREETWKLVRSTYSHSKTTAASAKPRRRPKSMLSESNNIRVSMDDTSLERRLTAKITIIPDSPPSVVIAPRNPRARTGTGGMTVTGDADGADEEVETVNKEEVVNALIQGLWIVWREGDVEDINTGRRNGLAPGTSGVPKRGFLDIILCR
jgi:hypothetical protein